MFSLFQFLLWSDIICMATLLLTTISCSWVKTSVALATDHLVTIVFLCEYTQRGFNDASSETKYQMEG